MGAGGMNFANIPEELRQRRSWVNWKRIIRDGVPTKLPVQPDGTAASSTDAATWAAFEAVVEAFRVRPESFAGIGFVFSDADPYCGIDFDKCRVPETGDVEPWASDVIADITSYTEVSQSKTGVHCIARFKLPAGNNKHGRFEMYDQGRFFVMTGDADPLMNEIFDRDLTALHSRLMTVDPKPPAPKSTGTHVGYKVNGNSESEEDFRLLGRVTRSLQRSLKRMPTPDEIEREFARVYPARYADRMQAKGSRVGGTYFHYSALRLTRR
jgi:primase-polymerase (primpol)-like protein